ncbi:hypothetical protein A3B05_02860 [Candidatus Giovannonibacteria bacterium RIFCSPLOWO2_01_FULL_43_160]|uniref:Glutamate--tRNA ligase n=1 Tax=Candidatus Giovannonibacteria bacterium RIFCSPLOWO2_12_FULL_43_26 TaxID=1798363 RepID=A0A1F5XW17_9BACT|nr:MAG: hypothetical protein A2652_01195 [Candidatus Giovannonibacteria bacterium RIFCSPHIGHO2_01_FULL_43_140]OGF69666.1 MAG: hypothetical protein A3C76_01820 [Candidatus Giovannonibacteria bacterium RIFCSPHIGHO2_02_FULL_44_51]OGF71161.1 MAG: hypothetical protein A3E35_02290 [Candidatus Giovannonibacteria bacterium RIFCSPHIGHO2_12_FULL_44_22]OGF74864.1 MAG: hypothetical protein A3B05_02860 [Candidatus Giovannonibacteria bacterium RIFCSPLOWO2_01_FULL_43_160]OGF86026.1 MAG: hypothetical protein A
MKQSQVRTRFAPSPTGFLHVGGLRTALYNYLFAKQNGGLFILRIEDTDRARLVEGAEQNILETLRIFGLDFDEGPIRQSDNLERYRQCAKELVAEGAAYGDNGAIRFRIIEDGATKFTDIIHGEIEIKNKTQEDFIILKSDGFPTYNLAHLVDDHDMAITHVIRGDEFISSMPKYIALHKAFGWELPQYAHLPLLLNKNRAKLSKREGDTAVKDFLDDGYLKEAILNFVALLGWHPSKSDREIFSLEDLIKAFKLEDVQKAGAIFDMTKLDWMNGEYIRRKSPRELLELAKPYSPTWVSDTQVGVGHHLDLEKIIALEQPRLKKLSELPGRTDYFFKEPEYDAVLLKWKQISDAEIKKSLETSKQILKSISDKNFGKENLEKIFLEKAGNLPAGKAGDRGELLWPLRVALTGKKASPGPFEIMEILGQKKAISRVESAISMLK